MNTIESQEKAVVVKSRARDRRLFLKVKIKSLAAESKIIRHEERKLPYFWDELRLHRITVVRIEARATQLAYGFIRGRSYKQVEANAHSLDSYGEKFLWDKVRSMVDKYGKVFDPDISYKQNANHKARLEQLAKWKDGV